jgi:hypothetical protein
MFSDHERLSTFIDNVSKNLQDQGLFISSYIDGFKVCNILSESENRFIPLKIVKIVKIILYMKLED